MNEERGSSGPRKSSLRGEAPSTQANRPRGCKYEAIGKDLPVRVVEDRGKAGVDNTEDPNTTTRELPPTPVCVQKVRLHSWAR
ncbi:unnamed protein product [Boreogadus saida]